MRYGTLLGHRRTSVTQQVLPCSRGGMRRISMLASSARPHAWGLSCELGCRLQVGMGTRGTLHSMLLQEMQSGVVARRTRTAARTAATMRPAVRTESRSLPPPARYPLPQSERQLALWLQRCRQ